MATELAFAKRHQKPLSLAVWDVDHFKKYVDSPRQHNQLAEEADTIYAFDDGYATMDGGGRYLRRRTSKPDFKNFLEDFDPGNSEREIRKRRKKLANNGEKLRAILVYNWQIGLTVASHYILFHFIFVYISI